MNLDIDKCITEPTQPFSIWKCNWSHSREKKICYKSCQDKFQLADGLTNLTCYVNSGWIKQTIAKCIPQQAQSCELLKIPKNQLNSTVMLTAFAR